MQKKYENSDDFRLFFYRLFLMSLYQILKLLLQFIVNYNKVKKIINE